jgi:hypothetical protein
MLRLFLWIPQWTLADAAQGGTVMDVENTDLERRVLAHEQILQVLIAHMAEAEPKFLDRLQPTFTKHHTLGADEHGYTGTAAHKQSSLSSKWCAWETRGTAAKAAIQPWGVTRRLV